MHNELRTCTPVYSSGLKFLELVERIPELGTVFSKLVVARSLDPEKILFPQESDSSKPLQKFCWTRL